ncbi:DUF3187 family protein [Kineobactrum salinum]|uniref:DUF3187 family protein n=1 Tax=Kineobactrum salinum TaxID=2708301 RepID=A0A6C0U021_9GAMM|nr:DUF3187 family protein [Kineobactrum salinum]QIB65258.1 DUF3187 family protein [Kineobactrum salinum]
MMQRGRVETGPVGGGQSGRRGRCPGLLAGLLLAVLADASAAVEPLYSKNLSPAAGLLGLPSPRAAALSAAGSWQLAIHGSIGSHFVVDENGAELLRLDGESQRLALELRHGLGEHWELQLELPWLAHNGGALDSPIDGWHDLWGMSDGGRSELPRDQLDFRYRGPGAEFTLRDSAAGAGDLMLALNRALWTGETLRLSAALGYKFATGSERELLGSGGEDAHLALRAGWTPRDSRFSWQGQAGYLRAGRSGLLGAGQRRELWFAGVALNWAASGRLALVGQIDAHGAPLDSALPALGGSSLRLSAGGRWQFSHRWALELSVVEDIRVETAPDVIFQASVRWRP